MFKCLLISCSVFLFSCKTKVEKIKPVVKPIMESVYASGILKSKDQYQAFVSVNGIIKHVFVKEGDTVKQGEPILSVLNETQRLNKENAELAYAFNNLNANRGKLDEARMFMQLSKDKMENDSVMYARQQALWKQQVGTKTDLEQRELAYESAQHNYSSSVIKYNDLKRQLDFTAEQSKKNLEISKGMENDYLLKSEINGIIYSLPKSQGEIVGPQIPLAIIGSAKDFILEMQVDEYDIIKIKLGQKVLVTMDSYKNRVFKAFVSRIDPFMNERSRTFLVEAKFTDQPTPLYPNITFEASIVLNSKTNALLIPRNYLLNDSTVIKSDRTKASVKTGLKDYREVEILSGISSNDELIKPEE